MLTSLSLRLRIFLFFVLMGAGGTVLAELAIYVGYKRALTTDLQSGFIYAGIISGFGLLALGVGIWLLFDENVAKPIERLAATMRTRAHAGVDLELDVHAARYLGDLAPAAKAVSSQLNQSTLESAAAVASETARLAAEKDRLTALLTDIPVAMVLVNTAHQIVLYDAQAAQALGQVAPPRLNAFVFDYFQRDPLLAAHAQLVETGVEVTFKAQGAADLFSFDARLKPLSNGAGYMILIDGAHAEFLPDAMRPLTYDFDLLNRTQNHSLDSTPIMALDYAVFDTETTGLLPHKDEVVQIGAVRVVNGRIVAGEIVNQLVNPAMKIPPASTKVHKISDDMVKDAPDTLTATKGFHDYARDSVIVAHNAPFDMAFMYRYGKLSGLDWDHPIVDTVLLSAVLFGASESHTLDALCDRLGVTIPIELRHTALGDAQATAEVLCKMLPMLTSRGYSTFGEVIEQTRKHGRLLQDLN